MSTTFSQQNHKVQVVIGGQKSNFSRRFKLETITTNHLWFVVKILWKMLWKNTFLLTIPLFLVVVNSIMIFYYFILTYNELIPRKLWKYCGNFLCQYYYYYYYYYIYTHKHGNNSDVYKNKLRNKKRVQVFNLAHMYIKINWKIKSDFN